MSNRVFRSINEPIREGLSWHQRWQGSDLGLITCWEVGRKMRKSNPELARQAENGALPMTGWKGGVEKATKKGEKFGSFSYLAQWQGLRGQDLDIELNQEITLVCAKTGMKVTYTPDLSKYANG